MANYTIPLTLHGIIEPYMRRQRTGRRFRLGESILKEIYLDNSATTQVDDRVIDYITKVMREHYGNPSSLYDLGLQSHLLMEEAAT